MFLTLITLLLTTLLRPVTAPPPTGVTDAARAASPVITAGPLLAGDKPDTGSGGG